MFAILFLQEEGPNAELAWLFYLFLAFFLLMVIVGWWVNRRGGIQSENTLDMHAHAENETTSHASTSHSDTVMTEIRSEAPAVHDRHEEAAMQDDLVRLEGIGPRVAKILNEAGITTFAALANANPTEIQKTLSAAGLQMLYPEGWIEQAALAAKGDWAGLEKLQNELKGGRRK